MEARPKFFGVLNQQKPNCLTTVADRGILARGRFRNTSRRVFGTLIFVIAIWASDLHPALGVSLAWDPSPDTNVTGYIIYWGTNSDSAGLNAANATVDYTARLDVGNQIPATLTNLPAGGTYYFVVTAYNADGLESLPSNEVAYTVPGSLRLTLSLAGERQINFVTEAGKSYFLQTSSNLVQWTTIQQMQASSNTWDYFLDSTVPSVPARFYRIFADP